MTVSFIVMHKRRHITAQIRRDNMMRQLTALGTNSSNYQKFCLRRGSPQIVGGGV